MFFESVRFLALNSHENICIVHVQKNDWLSAISEVNLFLQSKQLPTLQVLQIQKNNLGFEVWLTGPEEQVHTAHQEFKSSSQIKTDKEEWSTITMTCTGLASGQAFLKVSEALKSLNTKVRSALCQSNNITFLLAKSDVAKVLQELHLLIEKQNA